MDNQAIHNVLSNYVIENANLKIALEEQKMLIKELENKLEGVTKNDLPKTDLA